MLSNIHPDNLSVRLPNGDCIHSHSVGSLHLPNLNQAIIAHIFEDSELSLSLLSISDLCDAGCTATFSAEHIIIKHNECIIIQDSKQKQDSLWHVTLPNTQVHATAANVAYSPAPTHSSKDGDFVRFIHASFGSPALSTFTNAIRANYLPSIPRLTCALLASHSPHTIPTALGHLDQIRQKHNSTKRFISLFADTEVDSESLDTVQSATDTTIDSNTYTSVFALTETMHSDLTGKFPVTSFSGMQYIIVSVMDGYIHIEPMRSRHHLEYIAAYKRTINFFSNLGRKPLFQRLDNETSNALETFARTNNISIQYCAPHQHRALRAERAIRTFKNHFIATLCTVAEDFPLGLWDELLPQAELCLNHMLPYPSNPTVSAYAGLHGGPFDFAAHPIAPAGAKVVVHEKPNTRATWAPHGTHGYYLGPAQSHYRCYRVWATATKSVRVTDTIAWFLNGLHLPGPSAHDLLRAAITDLTHAVQLVYNAPDSDKSMHPTGRVLNTLTDTLQQLTDMYPNNDMHDALSTTVETTTLIPVPEQRVFIPVPEQRVQDTSAVELQSSSQQHEVPANTSSPISQETISSSSSDTQTPTRSPLLTVIPDEVEQNTTSHTTVTTPNTPISAQHRPRQHNARVPLPTDRVTRLDSQRKHIAPSALHSSATLNLDNFGRPLKYRSAKNGPNTLQWQKAEADEIQRLLDTDTIKAIHMSDQPTERSGESTYYNPQVKEKEAVDGTTTYRVRGTIGGDRIDYPGPTTARTAAMPLVKLLLQSVVSDDKRFLTLDIKDFYLNTPLDRPEYLRISSKFLPQHIIDKNSLQQYLHNGSILFEVNKGMYGLPQAGLLAQNRLIQHLAAHGYHQTAATCLFRHIDNGTDFCLVVDDFGVKYASTEGAQHLIDTLQKLYIITIDWEGTKYLGFTIAFNREEQYVDISMPGYIDKVLQRFAPQQSIGAASPALYTPPSYGNPDLRPTADDSPKLVTSEILILQEITGCLLYYARGIDITILTAVNHLASLQSTATRNTMTAAHRLLAYCSRYPSNSIRYHACDMILHIQSDASRPGARSVAGGIFYVGNHDQPTVINGAIHAISSIIPAVVASVAEAEYAALFMNGQEGASLRDTLNALGYPQPATAILCDNKCAQGIATDTIKPKRTKSVDMKFHWIRDRIRQG